MLYLIAYLRAVLNLDLEILRNIAKHSTTPASRDLCCGFLLYDKH